MLLCSSIVMRLLSNDHELVILFNEHYISIIKRISDEKPTNITKVYYFDNDKQAFSYI